VTAYGTERDDAPHPIRVRGAAANHSRPLTSPLISADDFARQVSLDELTILAGNAAAVGRVVVCSALVEGIDAVLRDVGDVRASALLRELAVFVRRNLRGADAIASVDDEIVLLRDIRLESYCEHHMVPIIGRCHIAYLPRNRVVGISKLARVADAFAKRLQIQEKLTVQIANTIDQVLQPRGTAVVIEAGHQCMTTRGVHKPGVSMVTSRMLGAFRHDPATRRELLAMIGQRAPGSVEL